MIRSAVLSGLTAALVLVGGAVPAWAAGPVLRWQSPKAITSGVPFDVSSITSCPPLPNPGDQLLVGVTVTFPGGGIGDVLPANSDGSWSGQLTFNFFSGTPRRATISADCEDYNGTYATSYAQYQSHRTQLISS